MSAVTKGWQLVELPRSWFGLSPVNRLCLLPAVPVPVETEKPE